MILILVFAMISASIHKGIYLLGTILFNYFLFFLFIFWHHITSFIVFQERIFLCFLNLTKNCAAFFSIEQFSIEKANKQCYTIEWKGEEDMKKFIPKEKLSKKARRKLNVAQRITWGAINPVCRKPANPKAYNRKKVQIGDDSFQSGLFYCIFNSTVILPV